MQMQPCENSSARKVKCTEITHSGKGAKFRDGRDGREIQRVAALIDFSPPLGASQLLLLLAQGFSQRLQTGGKGWGEAP